MCIKIEWLFQFERNHLSCKSIFHSAIYNLLIYVLGMHVSLSLSKFTIHWYYDPYVICVYVTIMKYVIMSILPKMRHESAAAENTTQSILCVLCCTLFHCLYFQCKWCKVGRCSRQIHRSYITRAHKRTIGNESFYTYIGAYMCFHRINSKGAHALPRRLLLHIRRVCVHVSSRLIHLSCSASNFVRGISNW